MAGRIIVLGGLNVDVVVVSSELPNPGAYLYGTELDFIPGGNGLNQAVAAARLGASATMVGFIGKDDIGRSMKDFLMGEKVDATHVKVLEHSRSGTVIYLLSAGVERHVVYPGTNMAALSSDLPDVRISSSDIVIASLTVRQEIIEELFAKAKNAGARTILNPFPENELSRKVLELSDYLILNEVELAYRSGEKELAMSHHKDMRMTPEMILQKAKKVRARSDQVIVTTLADRGAIGTVGEKQTAVAGIKVKFVDATGAGDCFLGSFATALSEGKGFKQALEFANCAAALSVQTIGTTTSFPKREAVDELAKRQK